jgi:hypothetical protein
VFDFIAHEVAIWCANLVAIPSLEPPAYFYQGEFDTLGETRNFILRGDSWAVDRVHFNAERFVTMLGTAGRSMLISKAKRFDLNSTDAQLENGFAISE